MSLDIWKFVLNVTKLRRRTPIIRCSSGNPMTPMTLSTAEPELLLDMLSVKQTFTCKGGVNTARLLQLTKRTLLEDAKACGANALINEVWSCVIFRRGADLYEVVIQYEAGMSKAKKDSTNSPVAIDKARGVPGVMTVLSATAT